MDVYYKRTEFPVQKLTIAQKDEEWKRGCVDVLISREGSTYVNGRSRKDIIRINYDLYNGIFDEDDFKYVVNPFNVEDGFPAHPQNFNIIKPKIDLLIGEETKRPFNFKVFSTNDGETSKILEMKKDMLVQQFMSSVVNGDDSDAIQAKAQEIDDYIKNKYSTAAEHTAYNSLQYLRQQLSLEHEFIKGWKDGLISGEEVYYTGIVNGNPVCERVNPYYFTYDNDPDLEYVEDGDWATRRFLMSPGAIYDRFQQYMEESDLDDLLKMLGGDNLSRRPGDVNYNSIIYKDKIISDINNDEFFKGQLLPVWHTTWRSFKKVGYLTYIDPNTGEKQMDIVDETYKYDSLDKSEGKEIEWDWITEIWEGYRIGTTIYLNIQPVQYQYTSIDTPKVTKLPYSGARYNSTNTRNRSLVDTMKSLQYMYIIIWYRIELALARDKGKILNMDITQIPKSMGLSTDKWLHYLTAIGVNFINPYEEGWDIPGREGGKPAAFNQMSAQDLSMTKVIMDYIGLLSKIEDMVGEISGVSRQREGQINTSELVGNVQRATVQSSHITEPLFEIHNQVKKRAITALLNCAKFAWSENDKKVFQFITDDYSRQFLEITDDFIYSDFDVFVADSTKENQNLEAIKSLAQPAMQSGATMFEAATMITTESITELKNKLKEIDARKMQMEQQAQQSQQQSQQQIAQMQQQSQAEANAIAERDSIRKAETAITVAQIQAESRGSESTEVVDSSTEQLKLQLQADKIASDERVKLLDLSETIRKNKADESLYERELEIKNKVASKPVSTSKTK